MAKVRSRQLWSESLTKGDAQRIRLYLGGQVDLAREKGERTVIFQAGDVHTALGLEDRMPNVCQVLKGSQFHEMCRVEIVRHIYSPPSGQGANLTIEFRVLSTMHD